MSDLGRAQGDEVAVVPFSDRVTVRKAWASIEGGDAPIPAGVLTHLVLIQTGLPFAALEGLFRGTAGSGGLGEVGRTHASGSVGQVMGDLARECSLRQASASKRYERTRSARACACVVITSSSAPVAATNA